MNSEYSKLINKIKVTGDYIDRLARIESDMKEAGCSGLIDNKAIDSLEKCIDDINKIYIDTGGYIDTDGERPKIKELQEQNSVLISIGDERGDKIRELEEKLEIQEDELIKAENELQQIKTDYNIEDK